MKLHNYLLILFLLVPALANAEGSIDQPHVKWKFDSGSPIRGAAVTDAQRIYFGNSEGILFCLDKQTAEVVWQYKTGGAINSQPALVRGKLIVQNRDNTVYALNATDGSLAWKFLMPKQSPHTWGWDYYDASPVVYGKNILIGSGDHKLYSLNVDNGKQEWAYVAGDKIRATPLVLNDRVFVPAFDGFIHVLDADKGDVLNKFETEGIQYYGKVYGWDRSSLIGKPAVKDNLMVIGSRDGGLYGLDVNTLEKKWRFTYSSSWVGSAPAIHQNTVFVGWSDAHVFSAHDLTTGKELWKYNGHAYFYSSPVTDAENVYTGSFNGHVYAFDQTTGEVVWAYQTGGAVLSSPVLGEGVLYIGSDNGNLYAFVEGKKTYKAVYAVETSIENEMQAGKEIAPWLEKKGYARLDSAGLPQFLKDRIADRSQSVVVFSHQYLPKEVAGENAGESLLKRYMEAGGKVVWLGYFPGYWVVNKDMRIVNMNPKFSEELLGIKFDVNMDFGTYFATSTREGKSWGLPSKFGALGSSFGTGEGLIPLAYNEFGRVASFFKPFGSSPFSGFVHYRSWSLMPITERDLEVIQAIGEYGF